MIQAAAKKKKKKKPQIEIWNMMWWLILEDKITPEP